MLTALAASMAYLAGRYARRRMITVTGKIQEFRMCKISTQELGLGRAAAQETA